MYMNTAYLKDILISPRTPIDKADTSVPLMISCCGVYRIHSISCLDTERPNGRKDFQLLYFHSGQGHFFLEGCDGPETVVYAGQMLLFHPDTPQMYYYYAEDRTEVYWVHFTGHSVKELLMQYDLPMETTVWDCGVHSAYRDIFLDMITELQLCKKGFEEMLTLKLRHLFLLNQRHQAEPPCTNSHMQQIIEDSLRYFNEKYNSEIVIRDYAAKHFLTPCWFISNFRQHTGRTPTQYITSIRITNAYTLLANVSYSIQEIAALVGYEDALYFSRIFKKYTGYSPREYRRLLLGEYKS